MIDLDTSIALQLERIAALDLEIEALVGEENQLKRLQGEVDALEGLDSRAKVPPALRGCLVGIKDIFHVDGLPTRAGSLLPPEALAGEEAACVRLLKEAGALVLGKTTTTEFAFFEPGPTRNPNNTAHTPGGSSSGSAAAVAAGYCPLAIGSQTVGSVIRPAAFCGVLGFKPSLGRIPSEGMLYYSPSVDTVGVFARSCAWMEVAASVLCANWKSVGVPRLPTVGIPEGPYLAQASGEALTLFEGQVDRLQRAGWTVRRVPLLSDIEAINARHTRLISGEMARVHAELFVQYEALYRPKTAQLVRDGRAVTEREIGRARAGCVRLREEVEAAMDASDVDMWLSPAATGPAPRGLASTGDPAMNLPWTHAGLPSCAVPCQRVAGNLPMGLQCVARSGQDELLLQWVRALEGILDYE